MSEAPRAAEVPEVPGQTRQFDYEIQFWTLVWMGIGLLALTLLSMFGVWFLYKAYLASSEAADPPPPVIARSTTLAPVAGPKLLSNPETELETYRRLESRQLETYRWVDRQAGVVAIPIDRAIDVALELGLVRGAPLPEESEPAAPMPEAPEASPADESGFEAGATTAQPPGTPGGLAEQGVEEIPEGSPDGH